MSPFSHSDQEKSDTAPEAFYSANSCDIFIRISSNEEDTWGLGKSYTEDKRWEQFTRIQSFGVMEKQHTGAHLLAFALFMGAK
jgi:hypothetical protein